MITCEQGIYDKWITIMQKYTEGKLPNMLGEFDDTDTMVSREVSTKAPKLKGLKQITCTMYRCLQGLDEINIQLIQDEILEKKILLAKTKDCKIMDMAERALQIKKDKVLQEEVMQIFHSMSQDGIRRTWQEWVEYYNISQEVYDKLTGCCESWLRLRLQRGKENPPLPDAAQGYLNWIHENKEGGTQKGSIYPWNVVNVGANLEGVEFIHNRYQAPLAIGVVVVDTLIDQQTKDKWDQQLFERLVHSLQKISSEPAQFLLLVLLDFGKIGELEKGLQAISGSFRMEIGSIAFKDKKNTFVSDAIAEFVVAAIVSKSKQFNDINRYLQGNGKPSITDMFKEETDDNDDEIESEGASEEESRPKNHNLIHNMIEAYCREDEYVFDVFTKGVASIVALGLKRRVVALVPDIQELKAVEGLCSSFAFKCKDISDWARIQVGASEHANMFDDDPTNQHQAMGETGHIELEEVDAETADKVFGFADKYLSEENINPGD